MSELEKVSQIKELADKILYHKRKYYAGNPEISDIDFDILESRLKQLDPNHPVLSYVGTDDISSTSSKVEHEVPMLSLEKTYDIEDLLSWIDDKGVVATIKIDGNSLSIGYRNNELVSSATRGNGKVGEDVFDRIRWVPSIPFRLEYDGIYTEEIGSVEIRGELCCSKLNFKELTDRMISLGLEPPVSARNIVAGLLGRKIHIDLLRYMSFYAFDVLGISFKNEIDKYFWLKNKGFLVPNPKLLSDISSVEKYVDKVIGEDFKDTTEVDGFLDIDPSEEIKNVEFDGVVFCYNDVSFRNLGNTSHHPRYKLAFKWKGESAVAKIVDINWSTSRLGIVTPVVVIEPVFLSGASISNVTMHNASYIKNHNIKINDRIEIIRSGEVIPKFLRVVESCAGECILPELCPSCGSRLEYDGVRLRCLNKNGCFAQKGKSILNWIESVKIEDLSEKRLESLIELGLVGSIVDLYKLEESDFLKLPLTKEKMATKLYNNIQASKKISLSLFLSGLGIEGMGENSWDKIIEVYPSLEMILEKGVDDFIKIDGLALKTASCIVEGLKENKELIEKLLDVGVVPFVEKRFLSQEKKSLEGKSFVITGALSRPREQIEKLIKEAGGRVGSSVSKNTDFIITNDTDSTSSKMVKAKALGIPVWNEEELYKNMK